MLGLMARSSAEPWYPGFSIAASGLLWVWVVRPRTVVELWEHMGGRFVIEYRRDRQGD